MSEPTKKPALLCVAVPPEREALVREYCTSFGYRIEKVEHPEHGDVEFYFRPENPGFSENEYFRKASVIFEEIKEIDRKVRIYYLKRVVLVGMCGAACIGLSFAALHFDLHILFTILLVLGIFGCTVTLYLRPFISGFGMKKYGKNEPELLSELKRLLSEAAEASDRKGGDQA